MPDPLAVVGGRLLGDLLEVTDDPADLRRPGPWAVVLDFEGTLLAGRFGSARPWRGGAARAPWAGPARDAWTTSLDAPGFRAAVDQVRAAIAAGDVYQVNVCRVLGAELPQPDAGLGGLAAALARGNPAPHAAWIRLPGLEVVSASPELYLDRTGDVVRSGPIKGTAATPAGLLAKDRAENVMIVDLVRHDLAQVAAVGSVEVERLCAVERHPGLVHLTSVVRATLRPGCDWPELLAATFPPGSVSGAPKRSALGLVALLEPVPRGPYCGAVGWVDGDRGVLAVGIRTFWTTGDAVLRFGTGAGITWDSDPAGEWQETELKAARLLSLAAGGVVE